jgi:8-oxo-dGTP diphosphatase
MEVNSEANIHSIVIATNMFLRKGDEFLVIRRSDRKNDLPNLIHSIGGKVNNGEDPLVAAVRELKEESGLDAKNVKLEAVITEVFLKGHPKYKNNWQVFHFSGDYVGGEPRETSEGELVWMKADDLVKNVGFPSLREVVPYIIGSNFGVVFARFEYDQNSEIVSKQIILTER